MRDIDHSRRPARFVALMAGVTLLLSACNGGVSHKSAATTTGNQFTTSRAAPRPVDWTAVDAALGRPGDVMAGNVHRYGFARSDLKVTLDGVALKPGFALGSYAAFVAAGTETVVMGDLVLSEPEVSPVMAKLQEHGFDVSAVHNHLLREQPKIMYMHYMGHAADAVTLARGLRSGLEASATPLGTPAPPTDSDLGFDPAALDGILGRTGKPGGGLDKYSIARAEAIKIHMGDQDVALTPALGVGTVINFQPLGGGKAAITGDFALLGSEVAGVASTLRSKGIEVTAIHTHMTNDQPNLYYMHFFANAPAPDLARGLRAALDLTNSAK
jgi:hypothetical protein